MGPNEQSQTRHNASLSVAGGGTGGQSCCLRFQACWSRFLQANGNGFILLTDRI